LISVGTGLLISGADSASGCPSSPQPLTCETQAQSDQTRRVVGGTLLTTIGPLVMAGMITYGATRFDDPTAPPALSLEQKVSLARAYNRMLRTRLGLVDEDAELEPLPLPARLSAVPALEAGGLLASGPR
jgi:hypothetical protein